MRLPRPPLFLAPLRFVRPVHVVALPLLRLIDLACGAGSEIGPRTSPPSPFSLLYVIGIVPMCQAVKETQAAHLRCARYHISFSKSLLSFLNSRRFPAAIPNPHHTLSHHTWAARTPNEARAAKEQSCTGPRAAENSFGTQTFSLVNSARSDSSTFSRVESVRLRSSQRRSTRHTCAAAKEKARQGPSELVLRPTAIGP